MWCRWLAIHPPALQHVGSSAVIWDPVLECNLWNAKWRVGGSHGGGSGGGGGGIGDDVPSTKTDPSVIPSSAGAARASAPGKPGKDCKGQSLPQGQYLLVEIRVSR